MTFNVACRAALSSLIFWAVSMQFSAAQFDSNPFGDMPPQPTEFGKCFAKCRLPDCIVETSKTVKVKDASSKKVVVPAVYENRTEQVVAKEASTRLVEIPARYENRTEQMLVKEASTKLIEVPASYRTETEQILVSPSESKWVRKKKAPNCFSSNADDCYVMCWEETPAKYKTITKQVVASPASTTVVDIPAEYKTVTKKVLVEPARTDVIEIPAEYKTITQRVLVSPAQESTVEIPAEYITLPGKIIADGGKFTDWVEVLCDSKINRNVVSEVQSALKGLGYNPGPIDGVMGSKTKIALEKYQQFASLPIGNLNVETLKSLGLQP